MSKEKIYRGRVHIALTDGKGHVLVRALHTGPGEAYDVQYHSLLGTDGKVNADFHQLNDVVLSQTKGLAMLPRLDEVYSSPESATELPVIGLLAKVRGRVSTHPARKFDKGTHTSLTWMTPREAIDTFMKAPTGYRRNEIIDILRNARAEIDSGFSAAGKETEVSAFIRSPDDQKFLLIGKRTLKGKERHYPIDAYHLPGGIYTNNFQDLADLIKTDTGIEADLSENADISKVIRLCDIQTVQVDEVDGEFFLVEAPLDQQIKDHYCEESGYEYLWVTPDEATELVFNLPPYSGRTRLLKAIDTLRDNHWRKPDAPWTGGIPDEIPEEEDTTYRFQVQLNAGNHKPTLTGLVFAQRDNAIYCMVEYEEQGGMPVVALRAYAGSPEKWAKNEYVGESQPGYHMGVDNLGLRNYREKVEDFCRKANLPADFDEELADLIRESLDLRESLQMHYGPSDKEIGQ